MEKLNSLSGGQYYVKVEFNKTIYYIPASDACDLNYIANRLKIMGCIFQKPKDIFYYLNGEELDLHETTGSIQYTTGDLIIISEYKLPD